MYLFVSIQLSGNRTTGTVATGSTDPGVLKMPLSAMAIVVYAAAIFVPRFLTRANSKSIDPENAPLAQLITLFFTPFIVRLALFEAVTLFGFVLVIAGREPVSTMLPFMAASVAGFVLNFPNESKIRGFLC